MQKRSDDLVADDDVLNEKKQIKNFRAQEKHKVRRKIDAYLDHKNLKELLDDELDDLNWDE